MVLPVEGWQDKNYVHISLTLCNFEPLKIQNFRQRFLVSSGLVHHFHILLVNFCTSLKRHWRMSERSFFMSLQYGYPMRSHWEMILMGQQTLLEDQHHPKRMLLMGQQTLLEDQYHPKRMLLIGQQTLLEDQYHPKRMLVNIYLLAVFLHCT